MWRQISITLIALICLTAVTLTAQENHYRKADHDLRMVYKQVTGESLEDAIDKLIIKERGGSRSTGNVIVRFNGGGSGNQLYIGRRNTLEFLVVNDHYLQAASLGFEFSCTAGSGSFDWVEGYGNFTSSDSTVIDAVKVHNEAFGATAPWAWQIGTSGYPDHLLLGGVAFSFSNALPPHGSPTVLYSMQIELPDDPTMVGDTFYIDNVFVPPAGSWIFHELPPGIIYPPDFQYYPNQDVSNPTAPPAGFPIAEPRCEFAGKSSNPNIVYIPNDSVNPPVNFDEIDIYPGKDGRQIVPVRIGFEGNIDNLKQYGIGTKLISKGLVASIIYIDLLPQLCQVKKVHYIMPAPKASPELNYSADDINCRYSLIQDSLGVSGDSVIIGIIDLGLDWLHEDFIDSNGNTRIRCFWDQTDQTGPNPTYPSCSIGTEFSYSTINGFIQTSQPGRDYHGHGTHVSGIAAGNNRSGGSQSFVGIAPKANIIFVKQIAPDYWSEAVEYIAKKSAQLDMPWVINMSLGLGYKYPKTHRGDHPLEIFIDSIITSSDPALGKGRVIVKSAGNDGDKSLHASCNGPGTIDLDVDTAPGNGYDVLSIYILYENSGVGTDAQVRVIGPNNSYDPVRLYCASNTASFDGWIADTLNTDGIIRVCHQYFDPYLPDPISGGHPLDNLIIIQIHDGPYPPNGPWYQMSAGTWQIEMDGTGLGRWDAWIYQFAPDAGQGSRKVFTGSHVNREHTVTVPGYANEIITVGSVNSSRRDWTDPHHNTHSISLFGNYPVDSISPFSSMGPSRDGRTKPDLYAPGAFIMSSRSANVTDSSSYAHNCNSFYHDENDRHYLNAGTSMAAPHVAGVAALMLDKNPTVYYSDILSCLRSTSSNGYDGKINAYDAIQCLSPPPCEGICGDANNDGMVNVADAVWLINYVFVPNSLPPQPRLACGDASQNQGVNVSDAVWIINFVFASGSPPGDCHPGSWAGQGGDCCPYTP